MFNHLLVPLDGSDNATSALKTAIQIARLFDSTITLVSVVNQNNLAVASGSLPYDFSDTLNQRAEEILDEGQKITDDAGIIVARVRREGIPKNEIITLSQDSKYDLIVMGKSGADALDRLLVGSTTAYVVRHAKIKVLVVPEV